MSVDSGNGAMFRLAQYQYWIALGSLILAGVGGYISLQNTVATQGERITELDRRISEQKDAYEQSRKEDKEDRKALIVKFEEVKTKVDETRGAIMSLSNQVVDRSSH